MTDNLKSLVFIALGEASMCWSNIDKAGIFESKRCEEIGNRLVEEINSVLKPVTSDITEEKQNGLTTQVKSSAGATAEQITPGGVRKSCAGCEEYSKHDNKDCSGKCPA